VSTDKDFAFSMGLVGLATLGLEMMAVAHAGDVAYSPLMLVCASGWTLWLVGVVITWRAERADRSGDLMRGTTNRSVGRTLQIISLATVLTASAILYTPRPHLPAAAASPPSATHGAGTRR
jgi:hypothetical protein